MRRAGPAGLVGIVLMLFASTASAAFGGPAPSPAEPPAGHARQLTGTVAVDGSSTVFPISRAIAEEFRRAAGETGGSVEVAVGLSGTGGGFRRFCAGETDISNASRPISTSEIDACAAAGVQFIELPVAFDGLTVVVNPANTFVDALTVSELRTMWEPAAQGTVTRWSQIRPAWPDRPFRLFGPGADSGTFDFFTEVVNGRERASRADYLGSEDDDVLVQAVASDPDALGYFGYAYYAANAARLRAVAIDGERGRGPVVPSIDALTEGTYVPLARPLFIYVKQASLQRREVLEFVRFSLSPSDAAAVIRGVGYVPLPPAYYQLGLERLGAQEIGTVFGGQAASGATLEDLFGTPPR